MSFWNISKQQLFIGYCIQGFVTWCAGLSLLASCLKQGLAESAHTSFCKRTNDIVFQPMSIVFIIGSSADLDAYSVAFHLKVHYFSNYPFTGYEKRIFSFLNSFCLALGWHSIFHEIGRVV